MTKWTGVGRRIAAAARACGLWRGATSSGEPRSSAGLVTIGQRSLLAMSLLMAAPALAQAPSLEEALDLLERERWNRAVSSFRWITREEPANERAWIGLVEALRGKGDLTGALEAADQAVLFPRVAPKALYLRGCVLVQQGESDAALAALERAVTTGFSDREAMLSEPALEALRDENRLIVPQGRELYELEVGDASVSYLLGLPPGFRASQPYPVLVAFGPGRQDLEAAEFLLRHFVGEQAVQMGWVVAAPEAPTGGWNGGGGPAAFAALLDELGGRMVIEGGRVHLVGGGNGAYSAFELVQAAPDRVRSLTAMSGAPAPGPRLEALAEVGVLQFVGEMDGTWISSVQSMHQALVEMGIDAALEVRPGERHFLGSLAGDALMLRIDALRAR